MVFKKLILSTTLIAGLAACASFDGNNEVEMLNDAAFVGSPFTQQLATEYRAFSNYELDQESDFADALHFARKGLSAADGLNVMPEPVHDWTLTPGDIAELSEAYARLVSAIDRGAREVLPGRTAIAQARYDCWIEEQEEVAKGGTSNVRCKDDFMRAMDEIEAALTTAPVAEEAFPQPVTALDNNQPLNIAEAMYLVFFDFDASNINNDAEDVIETVVNEVLSRNLNGVDIVGHTDTSGSSAYNQRLANRRANAVKAALVERGVPANMITTNSRGENELLVDTQDDIREPANRRAVITFR